MVEVVLEDVHVRGVIAICSVRAYVLAKMHLRQNEHDRPTPETSVSMRGGRVGGEAQFAAEVMTGREEALEDVG